jgi:hypothetical protein
MKQNNTNGTDWARKLGSRKFWALLAALAVSVLGAVGADTGTVEHVAAIISAVGACVGYMLAEGMADSARAQAHGNPGSGSSTGVGTDDGMSGKSNTMNNST